MTRKRQVLTLCLSLGLAACSDGDSSKPESGDAAVDGDNSAPIECNGDNPCAAGVCMGASCSGSWSCGATTVACAADLTDYCGCDGLTFQDSGSCPRKPFAYKGKCEDGVSCDVRQVTCSTATPACAYEEDVPRVVGSCYDGTCVPIGHCTCTTAADCPSSKLLCEAEQHRCLPPLMGAVK
jgi:hypothetical protein